VLIKQLGSIVLAVVVINLWEETVWAGFFQTRLEARFNFVVVAVLTALPFAGVHMPLLLLGDQVSVLLILKGVAGLLILGVVVRLLMGVMMRAALDSVLAVGVCIKSSMPATTTAAWSIRYWMAPMPAT
jgi:uncharacterized protein